MTTEIEPDTKTVAEVAASLAEVNQRIEAAVRESRRDPAEVRLVAVSKKQPDARVLAAYRAGQRRFGENYVQGLVARASLLPKDVELHLIGHLQTNKAKKAAEAASVIHTVDSLKVAEALGQTALPRKILIEVNLGDESQKAGIATENVLPLLEACRRWPSLEPVGLMCIPPAEGSRAYFEALRGLRDRLRAQSGWALPELSMGMSADYEAAILEGATLVRVGTAIFGARV